MTDEINRLATFSECGELRFMLSRSWGRGPHVCFIGHNPSTADARVDDPTVRRLMHFARAWGFTGLVVVNVYPKRSSTPGVAQEWADWENSGPDWWVRDQLWRNQDIVQRIAKRASLVVACWGGILRDTDYANHLLEGITDGVAPWPDIHVFGLTAFGAPVHPMARGRNRIPDDAKPILWKRGAGTDA